MGKRTALYEKHLAAGAKIVDFAGWDMPLHYGSQIEEHQKVRDNAGMFDVSHMTVVDIHGEDAQAYLRYVLANDVAKLKQPGKALYSCLLNEQGGVIDDLIAYYLDEEHYRLVVNAATRDKDLAWLAKQAREYTVTLSEGTEYAMIAIQGPEAISKVCSVLSLSRQQIVQQLSLFQAAETNGWFIARTGYTGEDGLEIILPAKEAPLFWQQLIDAGIPPCGLGARDTLRLEAGLNLYGADMNEETSALEANLGWTIAFEPADRNFIGRAALETQRKNGLKHRLVGLVLEDKGVLRNHQKVLITGIGEGEITSGSFSPTLNQAIALARVPFETQQECMVEIRGKLMPAKVVKPQFVRHGKALI